jgi:hypothetical protein
VQRQALVRVQDFNPFHRIADQGDLRRTLRLAWIEAALKVERAVAGGVIHDGEWSEQADAVQRFSAGMKVALKRQRDAAFLQRPVRLACFCSARCRTQVLLCRDCNRVQQYCSRACSGQARRERRREAAERYQDSPRGRQLHAERPRRWRASGSGVELHQSPTE